ncbi:MGMT family protein [Pelagibacterium montanilacus]|uniref:MGMT family protein n=1 Tax=Pelagibacterium montanilacus TaxID=2185280 RepID=UPI000F8E69AD|nr:MGMT family protein [Pelagibacterium montanilacus]
MTSGDIGTKTALLDMIGTVPPGRVTTAADLAAALDVPPKRVSMLLGALTRAERHGAPVHRVVPKQGRFKRPEDRTPVQLIQLVALEKEGLMLEGQRLAGFDALRWPIAGPPGPDDSSGTGQ